jgi:hypothetical protein
VGDLIANRVLAKEDVLTVSRALELALFMDAKYGRSIQEVAGFLCRSGTVEEVRRKAEELGLLQ